MSTLKESLSPSSNLRYEAPTPKASDVKIKKKEKKKQRRASRAVAMKKVRGLLVLVRRAKRAD